MARVPDAWVKPESNTHEELSPTMSRETSASVLYFTMPASGPPAASRNAALMSSADASRSSTAARSVSQPSSTGTRSATPSSRPASSGMTVPVARAAPVVVGMMLTAALRARRRSECGPSSSIWSPVYACTVVMNPRTRPNSSFRTFAIGATQFVVQEALETMSCRRGSYADSLIPSTTVRSTPLPGTDSRTFRAPPLRWSAMSSRSRNLPVDSITVSTPRAPQSIEPGSRWAETAIGRPATTIESSVWPTSMPRRP